MVNPLDKISSYIQTQLEAGKAIRKEAQKSRFESANKLPESVMKAYKNVEGERASSIVKFSAAIAGTIIGTIKSLASQRSKGGQSDKNYLITVKNTDRDLASTPFDFEEAKAVLNKDFPNLKLSKNLNVETKNKLISAARLLKQLDQKGPIAAELKMVFVWYNRNESDPKKFLKAYDEFESNLNKSAEKLTPDWQNFKK